MLDDLRDTRDDDALPEGHQIRTGTFGAVGRGVTWMHRDVYCGLDGRTHTEGASCFCAPFCVDEKDTEQQFFNTINVYRLCACQ